MNNNREKVDKYLISVYGERYRKYRDLWNKAGENGGASDYPLHLNFELNYGCNFKCKGCIFYVPMKDRAWQTDPKLTIPFDKYCEIIDEGAANDLYSIALNGWNEPLLKEDLVRYVNYARERNIMDISLHTNGLLLNEKKRKELLNSGLTSIMISVDAFKNDTYKKIYQVDKLDTIVSNVLDLIELREKMNKKLPLIRVSFIKTEVSKNE